MNAIEIKRKAAAEAHTHTPTHERDVGLRGAFIVYASHEFFRIIELPVAHAPRFDVRTLFFIRFSSGWWLEVLVFIFLGVVIATVVRVKVYRKMKNDLLSYKYIDIDNKFFGI